MWDFYNTQGTHALYESTVIQRWIDRTRKGERRRTILLDIEDVVFVFRDHDINVTVFYIKRPT